MSEAEFWKDKYERAKQERDDAWELIREHIDSYCGWCSGGPYILRRASDGPK